MLDPAGLVLFNIENKNNEVIMKKYIIFPITLILSILLYAGCEQTKTPMKPSTNESTVSNPYHQVGDMHNEGLDHILETLKDQLNSQPNGQSSEKSSRLYKSMKYGISTYVKEHSVNVKNFDKHYNKLTKDIQQIGKISNSYDLFGDLITNGGLSDNEIAYLNQLDDLIQTSSSINNLKQIISNANNHIINNFSSTKSDQVLAATSILISSTQYWNDNYDEWVAIITQIVNSDQSSNESYLNKRKQLSKQARWEWLKRIGKEDVKGGIIGGISGAIIGGTVTLGAATLPAWGAGVITGSLIGSATECITQIFNNI